MKIKTRRATVEEALAVKRPKHRDPKRPPIFWRTLIRLLSYFDLRATNFSYTTERMEEVGKAPA